MLKKRNCAKIEPYEAPFDLDPKTQNRTPMTSYEKFSTQPWRCIVHYPMMMIRWNARTRLRKERSKGLIGVWKTILLTRKAETFFTWVIKLFLSYYKRQTSIHIPRILSFFLLYRRDDGQCVRSKFPIAIFGSRKIAFVYIRKRLWREGRRRTSILLTSAQNKIRI